MFPHEDGEGGVQLRGPSAGDARAIHQLVTDSGVLEPNSLYAYLLLCTHFADTCLVAHDERGPLAGFVAAYRPPVRADTVFVWQIGVATAHRGRGLGVRLLATLLRLPGCAGVSYLEATVTASNEASQRLFESFAHAHDSTWTVQPEFTSDHFAPAVHEAEDLYRIGPLTAPTPREIHARDL